jgi:hypothetical protein
MKSVVECVWVKTIHRDTTRMESNSGNFSHTQGLMERNKLVFLKELRRRYGSLRKLDHSQSLYEIGEGAARVYIRYSKVHSRIEHLWIARRRLKNWKAPSLICFLWDGQTDLC